MSDLVNVPARAIADACEALWGERWQSTMARELGMNLRGVQRLAAAARDDRAYPVSRERLGHLLGELERRHRPLQRAWEGLKLIYDGA